MKWRVRCDRCRWTGYRTGRTREQVVAAACPRCPVPLGHHVRALSPRIERRRP